MAAARDHSTVGPAGTHLGWPRCGLGSPETKGPLQGQEQGAGARAQTHPRASRESSLSTELRDPQGAASTRNPEGRGAQEPSFPLLHHSAGWHGALRSLSREEA